ncbi:MULTISPECIES: SRPBCC family protein [Streptomyces]|uniref:Activator of Hsp90 ATPase homologue 1/2-like C-terminal domain-containing protein n=1 Tax=Streptomyces luteosporeus TaxID=173856 RepID=A0ABP6G7Q5_9ACTN
MSTPSAPHEPVPGPSAWPDFSDLEPDAARERFPVLNAAPARSIAQDRWERIVARAELPEPLERVWQALTEPEHIRHWLAECRGTPARKQQEYLLDFEDGEFFQCRTEEVTPPFGADRALYRHLWRWAGVGPATRVTWELAGVAGGTQLTATEESLNPPSDWRSWNGNGWPGILDQLAAYLRTGTTWRWPWRRMGPYVQIELAAAPYDAWDALTTPGALRHWLQRRRGDLTPGSTLVLVMGDASGIAEMTVHRHVEPNQEFPSYLPWLEFGLRRASWPQELGGKLYIEPAGLDRSLLQIFVDNWENVPAAVQREERRVVAGFFRDAMVRAQQLVGPQPSPARPHGWA